MPLDAEEVAFLGTAPPIDPEHREQQTRDEAPDNKVGKWTLVALILNRTMGSGIFLIPHRVLQGTGSVGAAMFCWSIAGVVSICGLYVWLECGLSMPLRRVDGQIRGVPRSGGDKNYLEFMFPNSRLRLPHIRTTCSFSIMFILMYNLSANAIGCAIQILIASGYYHPAPEEVPSRAAALPIAIGLLSLIIICHTFSRRGGIIVNNLFAIFKVALLLVIICLGIAKAGGALGGSAKVARNNFTKDVFKTHQTGVPSWSTSLMLCMYAFSGFKQPFYILAETKSPRKNFPVYTVLAMGTAIILFILVNISYLLVVDKNYVIFQTLHDQPESVDIATLFFDRLFEDNKEGAARALAALIAVSIFGNLWVMTFTAARVKQEIAKEGILPWSLKISTPYRTPYGMWQQWRYGNTIAESKIERHPTAAFALHWLSSVLLIVVTAPIADPRKSYFVLVTLYTYTISILLGFWVSAGLIYTNFSKLGRSWQEVRRYRPWCSPFHVYIFAIVTAFILIAAFVPPKLGSPYHQSVTGVPWYLIPVIGLTAPTWGVLYYWALLIFEWAIGKHLVVVRTAFQEPDPKDANEYTFSESIEQAWHKTARQKSSGDSSTSDVDLDHMPEQQDDEGSHDQAPQT